ncbi:MAG: DUF2786 domain-containing protein [Actinomycetota bacterium]
MTVHTTAAGDAKRTKVVEKVRALLAKAASTEHEAEAEAFEEHALRLMADYEIAERELRDVAPHDAHEIDCSHFGRAQTAAVLLCAEVAAMFGGYGVKLSQDRRFRALLMCTPSQLELALPLIDHLLVQLMADLNRDRPRSRRDYSLGWAHRVVTRLEAAQERIYSEAKALVPTTDAAEAAFIERYGQARRARRQTVGPEYAVGQEAGEEADLRQHRLGGAGTD